MDLTCIEVLFRLQCAQSSLSSLAIGPLLGGRRVATRPNRARVPGGEVGHLPSKGDRGAGGPRRSRARRRPGAEWEVHRRRK